MELTGAWQPIIDQGPLFAFMAITIGAAIKYIKHTLEETEEREKAREVRYNQLIDKTLETASTQTRAVTEALVGNTEILRRVEHKLNGTQYTAE